MVLFYRRGRFFTDHIGIIEDYILFKEITYIDELKEEKEKDNYIENNRLVIT